MSLTTGINGSTVHSSTGNKLLDLSIMLNRGLPEATIKKELDSIFRSGTVEDKIDAFVLAYQTRDIRGGKGERDLYYHFFNALATLHPKATLATLPLISTYGCWRDVFKLMDSHFNVEFMDLVVTQLRQDATSDKPSLLAKHAPREHNKVKQLANRIAKALNPGQAKANELYRKLLSSLNKRLQTVEVTMCAQNFAAIDPAKIPGRALKLYTKAFLNQPVTGRHGRREQSEELDRITAAMNFKDHFALAAQGKAKVNGANTVYPHELVAKILAIDYDTDAVEAQWQAIVKPIKTMGILSRTIAMCDFSGSMSGDPMNVSMALGLLIAECNTGVFKDHILTFDSTPTLHKIQGKTIVERVNEVKYLAQGLSTNFEAAYNLLLEKMREQNVPLGEEPTDLIVLTDMGWDAAANSSKTHPTIARQGFIEDGWQAPRIVIWNLRASFQDFHATALESGVVQLAGWSPSLLKVLIKNGVNALTPLAMLRAQLDDERYTPVRDAVSVFIKQ